MELSELQICTSQANLTFLRPLLILYSIYFALVYAIAKVFAKLLGGGGGGERETEKETDTGVQIGQYSNRRDVSEKRKKEKNKIKEIKRCLREKRIGEVLREKRKRGEENGTILDNSRPLPLSNI